MVMNCHPFNIKSNRIERYHKIMDKSLKCSNKRKIYNPENSNGYSFLDTNDISTCISSMKPNDECLTLIKSTKKHDIYFVNIKVNNSNLLLKVLKQELNNNDNNNDKKYLDNELSIGQQMNHPSFRSSLSSISTTTIFDNRHALILEYVKGNPIDNTTINFTTNIKEFLIIAREITSSLLHLHAHYNSMHLNLSCDHILHDPEESSSSSGPGGSIKIIGYSSAANFSSNKTRSYITTNNKELFENKYDLRYISPEQTGRMNHQDTIIIDYRADFYSLGIIFYKLLTQTFPFDCEKQNNNNNDTSDSTNDINLIHSHLFQEPVPICDINKNVPKILSDFILKLLNKSPDDRYQSCKGIIYDIDLLLSEYDENMLYKSEIVLAQHDMPDIFLISQKLYGRSVEYCTLLSVFKSVSLNSSEVVFITGDSGTGKRVNDNIDFWSYIFGI